MVKTRILCILPGDCFRQQLLQKPGYSIAGEEIGERMVWEAGSLGKPIKIEKMKKSQCIFQNPYF